MIKEIIYTKNKFWYTIGDGLRVVIWFAPISNYCKAVFNLYYTHSVQHYKGTFNYEHIFRNVTKKKWEKNSRRWVLCKLNKSSEGKVHYKKNTLKRYSLCFIIIESFCHFSMFHSNRVISLYNKSQRIFSHYFILSYFIFSLSLYLFHF